MRLGVETGGDKPYGNGELADKRKILIRWLRHFSLLYKIFWEIFARISVLVRYILAFEPRDQKDTLHPKNMCENSGREWGAHDRLYDIRGLSFS